MRKYFRSITPPSVVAIFMFSFQISHTCSIFASIGENVFFCIYLVKSKDLIQIPLMLQPKQIVDF